MRRTITMISLLMAVTLLLAGCGSTSSGGGNSPQSAAPQAQTAQPAVSTPAASSAASPAATSQAAATSKVSISNFSFQPSDLTVKKGTEITFTNNDSVKHNVTFGTEHNPVQPGQSFKKLFDKTGSFDYSCSIHPSMTGKITVQ